MLSSYIYCFEHAAGYFLRKERPNKGHMEGIRLHTMDYLLPGTHLISS